MTNVATGDGLVLVIYGEGAACSMTVSDTMGSIFGTAKICGNSITTHPAVFIFAGLAATTGSDTFTVSSFGGGAANGQVIALDYSGVTGFGNVGTNQQQSVAQGSFTNTVTLTSLAATSWVVTGFTFESPTSFTAPANSVQRSSGSATSCPTGVSTCPVADIPATSSLSWSYTDSSACNPGLCGTSQSALELLSGQTTGLGALTQCYGNCGSPPITLANTNSTHTVAFNQSVMLLYTFQSNLNGFLLNVTTNAANTNRNNGVQIVVYVIPGGCGAGVTPFSGACPGILTGGVNQQAYVKGRLSNIYVPPSVTLAPGEWVAIALQCTFAPCDFNDTNTSVPLFQANGAIPAPSTVTNTLALGSSKFGLWAWITGNTVTGAPPTVGVGGNCGGFLDCIVPNLAASLCNSQTTTCVSVSALIWAGLLGLFFTAFTLYGFGNVGQGIKLPVGEVFLFWVLVWILAMSGLGLVFAWVPLFFFFVISLLWGKHTGRYL